MSYKIVIEPRALLDIQDAVDYYDFKQIGLGAYFFQTLEEHIEVLNKNPSFQIRYRDYHGLPIQKFPFIIFYFTDEEKKIVYIVAVFNTSLNPNKYPK
jgi:plasmid stabilization system protein ParE